MSGIFHHTMRYDWVERNPIKIERQSANRERTPDVIELAELQLLLNKLAVLERTLALLYAASDLRGSKLLALGWRDVDFENLQLRVTRSIWHQVMGNCKIEGSAKPVESHVQRTIAGSTVTTRPDPKDSWIEVAGHTPARGAVATLQLFQHDLT